MKNTELQSQQAYPITYSRVWGECFTCGGKGVVESKKTYREVICPECEGEQGRWVEEKR